MSGSDVVTIRTRPWLLPVAAPVIATVIALATPASAGDPNITACRYHEPPATGSCVFDHKHHRGAWDDIYSTSYRLWSGGFKKAITHHRAHHLLFGDAS